MWSNPTICSENCRNNKKVEKRKNGDKGDKKSSQVNTIVMLKTPNLLKNTTKKACLAINSPFFILFLSRSWQECVWRPSLPHLTLVYCHQSIAAKNSRNKGQKIRSIVMINLIDSALWFLNPKLSCQFFPHEQS